MRIKKNEKQSDDLVYTSIYNKHVDGLFSYGVSLGFDREIVKDAIHDVFLKLYNNYKLFESVTNLKHYLFRMMKNRLLDIHKSQVETSDISDCELHFSIKATILDELINEEDRIAVENKIELLLSCLTNRQREAVFLRFMQEMEYEEIAVLLDMTAPSVRKLISRAMERMREINFFFFF